MDAVELVVATPRRRHGLAVHDAERLRVDRGDRIGERVAGAHTVDHSIRRTPDVDQVLRQPAPDVAVQRVAALIGHQAGDGDVVRSVGGDDRIPAVPAALLQEARSGLQHGLRPDTGELHVVGHPEMPVQQVGARGQGDDTAAGLARLGNRLLDHRGGVTRGRFAHVEHGCLGSARRSADGAALGRRGRCCRGRPGGGAATHGRHHHRDATDEHDECRPRHQSGAASPGSGACGSQPGCSVHYPRVVGRIRVPTPGVRRNGSGRDRWSRAVSGAGCRCRSQHRLQRQLSGQVSGRVSAARKEPRCSPGSWRPGRSRSRRGCRRSSTPSPSR